MGRCRQAALFGVCALACARTAPGVRAPSANAIVTTIVLPAGFVKPPNEEVHIIIDEKDGGASLFDGGRALSTTTVLDNIPAQTEIASTFDVDSNYEWRGRVMGWPFGGDGTWTFDLEGEITAEFRIIARIVSANVTYAEGIIDSDQDGGPLMFGPVTRYARVLMTATDAGSGDAGADAGAGAVADAGADGGTDGGTDGGYGGYDGGYDAGEWHDDGGYMPWDAGPCELGMAGLVARGNPIASSPAVALDSNGGLNIVWTDTVGPRVNVLANRFEPWSGAFGDAGLIGDDANGNSDQAAFAVDWNGNGAAVWRQFVGNRTRVIANRATADGGYSLGRWNDAGAIDNGVGDAGEPQVAWDGMRNAHAVWLQRDGTRDAVWWNRLDLDAGRWLDPARIDTNVAGGNAVGVRLSVASGGSAFAVWREGAAPFKNVWANRFVLSQGRWDDAGPIDTGLITDEPTADVKADPMGNAIAVWANWDGARNTVWANRFDSMDAGRWGSIRALETNATGESDLARIGVDGWGNAIAVWKRDEGGRSTVWANRYSISTDRWGDAGRIEAIDAGTLSSLEIAVDWAGNAVVAWSQYTWMKNVVFATRYVADGGYWFDAGALYDSPDAGTATAPKVTIDWMGRPIVVWQQDNPGAGTTDIWASACR
ncbi:MAG: hypothetical protein HYY84_10760 [Deltaproteobacteria bacterium]|nr:hypothetical protein [Deltaproteobacteria bacterium]